MFADDGKHVASGGTFSTIIRGRYGPKPPTSGSVIGRSGPGGPRTDGMQHEQRGAPFFCTCLSRPERPRTAQSHARVRAIGCLAEAANASGGESTSTASGRRPGVMEGRRHLLSSELAKRLPPPRRWPARCNVGDEAPCACLTPHPRMPTSLPIMLVVQRIAYYPRQPSIWAAALPLLRPPARGGFLPPSQLDVHSGARRAATYIAIAFRTLSTSRYWTTQLCLVSCWPR